MTAYFVDRNVATDRETWTLSYDYLGMEEPYPAPLPPEIIEDLGGPEQGYPEYGYLVPAGWRPPFGQPYEA